MNLLLLLTLWCMVCTICLQDQSFLATTQQITMGRQRRQQAQGRPMRTEQMMSITFMNLPVANMYPLFLSFNSSSVVSPLSIKVLQLPITHEAILPFSLHLQIAPMTQNARKKRHQQQLRQSPTFPSTLSHAYPIVLIRTTVNATRQKQNPCLHQYNILPPQSTEVVPWRSTS